MAEKTLNAWVVLGGKIDNSFQQLGQNLFNLGSSIDGISQRLINFGKESVKTYRSYEDSMLEAEVALSTSYGRGTKALNDVMGQLDRQASEWAATTIFHTDDVANAIAEAAHANWDLDKIIKGMPAAMKLAQAGSLDLSTGLDYIIKSVNAAGIGFDDLGTWIDEWTYAANSSAGDVEQFGEAMLKMGSTMKFADNKEELLTMLAVMHDAGTTGSNAGTLLRNSMIRLVAPTKKASDAMAELGATQEEIDEAMGETNGKVAEAVATLEAAGFSAYDSKGNLKDFTTIFEDLNKATKGMTEQQKYDIWSSIFPTRTITGAMALIEAADKNWNGLLDDLKAGKAEGYGDYASETMMSGLTGSIETFNSKVEDLRKEVGEQLAPQLETVLTNLGKVVDLVRNGGQDNGISSGLDWITGVSNIIGEMADNTAGMDPAIFDALTSALGSIATLGPALTIGGLAIRGIGTAMSVFTGSTLGKLILVAAAIGTVATAIKAYGEAKYLENFGELSFDTTVLDQKMTEIHDAFIKAAAPTEQFAKALDEAVKNYNTASTTFTETMISDLLLGETLTDTEKEKKLEQYRKIGDEMVGALRAGIERSADMSANFWAALFTGQGEGEEEKYKNEVFNGILLALDTERGEALARAEQIGNDLQNAINSAWADGKLDPEEYENIKSYFKELNKAIVEAQREAQDEQDFIKRSQLMDKMQGMSYKEALDYINKTIIPQRQEELDWYSGYYSGEQYRLVYSRNKLKERQEQARKNGDYELAEKLQADIDKQDSLIDGADEQKQKKDAEIYAKYDRDIMMAHEIPGIDSDLGLSYLKTAAEWLMSGQVADIASLQEFALNKGTKIGESMRYYGELIEKLGGMEAVQERADLYAQSGNQQMERQLRQILAMYTIAAGSNQETQVEYDSRELKLRELESMYKLGFFGADVGTYLNLLKNENLDEYTLLAQKSAMYSGQGDKAWYLNKMEEMFGQLYDLDLVGNLFGGRFDSDELRRDFSLLTLLGMSEKEREKYKIGGEESTGWRIAELEARIAAIDAEIATQEQRASEPDDIFGKKGDALIKLYGALVGGEYQGGGLYDQKNALEAELALQEQAKKEAETTRKEVQGVFNDPFSAIVEIKAKFPAFAGWFGGGGEVDAEAYGGRSENPALIAERGVPEWYIPEEHTPNTKRLILAAAANSGFSIVDLAKEAGMKMFADGGTDGGGDEGAGLDWGSLPGESGGGSGSITVQYSPVIHADNAEGVEQKLKEDKARLEKWFTEFMEKRQMYQDMVVYS
jgi:TP901 family phage tail tape measure protein